MNWKQWLVLACGLIFMGVNLLFPRSFHGWKYHLFTTTVEYQQPEMIARQLTLLAIVLILLLLLREGRRALNGRQKAVLGIELAIWLAIFLFPPDTYDAGVLSNFTISRFYFLPYWDARTAHYHFANLLLGALLATGIFLIPLLGHRLSRARTAIIAGAFALIPICQLFYIRNGEERPFISEPLFAWSAVGIMVLLAAILLDLQIGILPRLKRQG